MKQGFVRPKPTTPGDLKPQPIKLLTPLKVPPPEGKSPWLIIIGIVVIGLVVGMVAITFASGARTFNGMGAIFPVISILGIGAMLFGGRFGGGGQHMTRGKLDALRARFLLVLDELRDRVSAAADDLDNNYRWYHPPVDTLTTAVGGPRMWERNPNGKDTWFGVARVGVGMTSLVEGGAVTFSEPDDMPTEIELEPATGKALQEFVRYQSVAYGTPALISLLVEPGYRIVGERPIALALMRAIIAQLVFAHGPDHLQLVIVTDDTQEWDWVKWLPHNGNPRQEDGAGPARMVYTSVEEFANSQFTDAVRRGGAFTPRHAASRDAVAPLPHTLVVSDIAPGGLVLGDDVDRCAGMDVLRHPRRCAGLPRRARHPRAAHLGRRRDRRGTSRRDLGARLRAGHWSSSRSLTSWSASRPSSWLSRSRGPGWQSHTRTSARTSATSSGPATSAPTTA